MLVRHEQGGAHAADGYARVTGRVGVCMGTSGPGRDEPRHRHRDGAARLRADGRDHRQRARRPDRQGRLPGDRHQRHHAADDQAQLPGPRRRRPAAGRRRGVPHRPDRPAGPGPHRHHQGRPPAGDARRAPDRGRGHRRAARLPPEPRRPRPPAQARGRTRSPRPSGRSSWPATASSTPRPGTSCVAFAEKTQIPVAWTLLGIGAIDETHPLAYGYMGMHGWKHVNRAIQTRRPADRDRDALRRPGHRQRPDLRAVRPDRPRRHRPGRDRQERGRRGADRRRRRSASSRR